MYWASGFESILENKISLFSPRCLFSTVGPGHWNVCYSMFLLKVNTLTFLEIKYEISPIYKDLVLVFLSLGSVSLGFEINYGYQIILFMNLKTFGKGFLKILLLRKIQPCTIGEGTVYQPQIPIIQLQKLPNHDSFVSFVPLFSISSLPTRLFAGKSQISYFF